MMCSSEQYFPKNYTTPTPSRAAPLLIPRPRAAARLIHKQLSKNPVNLHDRPDIPSAFQRARGPQHAHEDACSLSSEDTYLKNATRDRERSSSAVREDANIFLRTAGVTGMRLRFGEAGGSPALGGVLGPEALCAV